VVLRKGCEASPAELIQFVKGELGSIQAPKSVHLLAEMPRNEVGKVLRRDVKALFSAASEASEASAS
jgi:fatty-acyl-CoA synthase